MGAGLLCWLGRDCKSLQCRAQTDPTALLRSPGALNMKSAKYDIDVHDDHDLLEVMLVYSLI